MESIKGEDEVGIIMAESEAVILQAFLNVCQMSEIERFCNSKDSFDYTAYQVETVVGALWTTLDYSRQER